ncbi:MAG TPA: helix-turn-helix domain-containing protein [Vicinamibacteria bacterium]|nr:helix-turn-helix domain-containing protein [Vicinamibacteria bacterium]
MLPPLSERDYYQVLEVDYDASPEQIRAAYEEAKELYHCESLVTGSILTDQERRGTFHYIAEAYQTLIAAESRRMYDERMGIVSRRTHPRTRISDESSSVGSPFDASEEHLSPARSVTAAPPELRSGEEATGEYLRRARQVMGIDLTAISEETKIGRSMLEYIEEERLDRLPAPIYLKNFTLQIARCLGLDEQRVARSYVARIGRLQTRA